MFDISKYHNDMPFGLFSETCQSNMQASILLSVSWIRQQHLPLPHQHLLNGGKKQKWAVSQSTHTVIKQQPSCICPLQAILSHIFCPCALNTSLFGRRPTGMWCHVPKLPDSQMTIGAFFLEESADTLNKR